MSFIPIVTFYSLWGVHQFLGAENSILLKITFSARPITTSLPSRRRSPKAKRCRLSHSGKRNGNSFFLNHLKERKSSSHSTLTNTNTITITKSKKTKRLRNPNPKPMEIDSLPNGNSATASPPVNNSSTATPPAAPFPKLTQLTEALKLEHQFLRVPFEHYKKTIRANHRSVEKEVSSVISGVGNMADSESFSKDDAVDHLTSLVSRLQGLKRKVRDVICMDQLV